MKPCRIWTTFDNNGRMDGAHRELYKITRNEFDDYLFHLDGGEVWQFTTRNPTATPPEVENISQIGIGENSATKKPGFICFLILKNKESTTGNLRIFPPGSAPDVKPKTGSRKRGKKHNLAGREKGSVASLIREIRGGKRKQGEEPPTDKEVVAKLLERAKTHSLLKERTMPGVRTLEGWVAIVRKGGTIPGAHR